MRRRRLDRLLVEGRRVPPRGHQPSLPTGENVPPGAVWTSMSQSSVARPWRSKRPVTEPSPGDDERPRQAGHSRRSGPVPATASPGRFRPPSRSATRKQLGEARQGGLRPAVQRVVQHEAVERGRAAQRRGCDRPERVQPGGAGQRGCEVPSRSDREVRVERLAERDAQAQDRAALAVLGRLASGTMPASEPRKFRNRCAAGSNASPRNRRDRQALASTAPQPSTFACDRSTVNARATSSVQKPNFGSGTGPIACCQIPRGPVMAARCAPADRIRGDSR